MTASRNIGLCTNGRRTFPICVPLRVHSVAIGGRNECESTAPVPAFIRWMWATTIRPTGCPTAERTPWALGTKRCHLADMTGHIATRRGMESLVCTYTCDSARWVHCHGLEARALTRGEGALDIRHIFAFCSCYL
ncbi:hypothetical protein SCLCIDRAFT_558466 [Scleroderma citrinum Foug A]|uniref:Uncharacterized protein n=1 Tax=Scleroderma citrinum Foug A TaxID=1036808 RepID=A0A0C3CV36_9AGAM|nr:hypothetical protein SCLCIDRAFT_558466 [Scleroderma citrinum Foug A]